MGHIAVLEAATGMRYELSVNSTTRCVLCAYIASRWRLP